MTTVEIPEGSGNRYRYEYEEGATVYKGPVGTAPELSEEEFLEMFSMGGLKRSKPSIEITWEDRSDVPINTPIQVSDILKTDAMKKAMAHIAVERDEKYAAAEGRALVNKLRRLTKQSIKEGLELHVSIGNQSTSPPIWSKHNGLGVGIVAVKNSRIVWNAQVFSDGYTNSITYRSVDINGKVDPFYRRESRADVFARRIPRW